MSTIKRIPKKDMDVFIDIQADAYPGMGMVTKEDKERARKHYLRTLDDPRVADYGLYEGGRLLGAIRLFDFTMNLFGARVLAGGGGSLGVSLLDKRQHVAKRLMQFYFNHYRRKGSPIAVLWPFRPDFYRCMGAGCGPKIHQYRIRPADLPRGRSSRHVRWLKPEDIPALNDCYNRWVDRTNGAIESIELERRIRWDMNQKARWIGHVKSGKVLGYLMFTFEKASDSWLDNNIRTTQLVYESPDVLQELMTFLHTQCDQINRIEISTPDDDFHFLLSDPRDGTRTIIPPLYHQCHVSGVGLMYRVLDVEHLFDVMAERNFHGQTLKLGLIVTDSFLRANHGRRVVHFRAGKARVMKSTAPTQVEMKIDNADFSSLILGAVKLRSLYDYGLVKLSDGSYADKLNSLFSTPRKPFANTMF